MRRDAGEVGLRSRFADWIHADAGVTSIEYALVAALIAVIIIGSVTMVGSELRAAYEYVADCVKNLSCA